MSKYRSKKVTAANGEVFDSRKEYFRWHELCLLEKAGEISQLKRQVKFELIPAKYETIERYSEKTGKRLKDKIRTLEQECSYYADFVYQQNGETIVEDTKGVRTSDYIIKRKLMLHVHGIRVREV